MQLMLSTIVKLPFLMSKKSIFSNDKIKHQHCRGRTLQREEKDEIMITIDIEEKC